MMKLHCCEVEGRGSYLDLGSCCFQQDVTAEKDMKWRRRDHGFANVEENTFFRQPAAAHKDKSAFPFPTKKPAECAVVVLRQW